LQWLAVYIGLVAVCEKENKSEITLTPLFNFFIKKKFKVLPMIAQLAFAFLFLSHPLGQRFRSHIN